MSHSSVTKYLVFLSSLLFYLGAFAQKQTFDLVTYNVPSGWEEKQGNGNISYSKIDGGSWAQIAIYQHRTSEANIQTDFDKDWNDLIANGKTISTPEKTKPKTVGGWTVMSGSGIWQYNGSNVAAMLTVYSNNNVCVAVSCNATAQQYLKNYTSLISSLSLNADNIESENNSNNTGHQNQTNNLSVVGTWDQWVNERGTSGFFRSEYVINANGTYLFLQKNCSAIGGTMNFHYETGIWKINGNQLTIIPKQGKNEVLEKPANNHWGTDWGKLIKAEPRILQTVTYTFKLSYDEYYKMNFLGLYFTNPTERDGGSGSVVFHKYDKPYITLPHKLSK